MASNYQVILAQHTILQEIAWSNSHELRKPVCSVLGLTGLLKDAATEEEIRECLTLLEACTEELDQIIQKTIVKISQLELDERFEQSWNSD